MTGYNATTELRTMIIFIDCGDTLIDESSQVMSSNGDVLRAEMFDGARETLSALYESGYRMALVADGRTASFNNIFQAHQLTGFFETLVISEEIGTEKPDELMFKTAMARMNLDDRDGERIIMIGNNLKRDILGARRMGLKTVLLSHSPRYCMVPENDEEQPDYIISQINQLPGLVAELEQQLTAARIMDWDNVRHTGGGGSEANFGQYGGTETVHERKQ